MNVKHKTVNAGPSDRQKTEYGAWESLLPSLIDPYLLFLKVEEEEISASMLSGQVLNSECDGHCVDKQETKVLCLFLECMSVNISYKHIEYCSPRLQVHYSTILRMPDSPSDPCGFRCLSLFPIHCPDSHFHSPFAILPVTLTEIFGWILCTYKCPPAALQVTGLCFTEC